MNLPFKKRVLIIDDDQSTQMTFSLIVNSNPKFFVVNTYGNCEDAISNLKRDKPEIVLIDIDLPGMNGIEGTKQIKERYPSIELIILTTYEDIEFVVESLRAGAGGFITKTGNYIELIDALEEIGEGGAPLSPRIARRLVETFRKNPCTPLTRRETTILQLMAKGKTYSEIAHDLFIEPETSKTHIKNIYSKLQVHTRSEAVTKALDEKLI